MLMDWKSSQCEREAVEVEREESSGERGQRWNVTVAQFDLYFENIGDFSASQVYNM